ncbi:hypothetical protein DVH24_019364 [Malus domestica]|uniref:Uncharacterized protein n=1 Tax=Malus domestica TaxID=3750 RepID=A0A498HYL9_MALDO|nr:hypothetical protein DVH24_019364 [Malus domestica]
MKHSRLTSLFNLYWTKTNPWPYKESSRGTLNDLYNLISRSGHPTLLVTSILDDSVTLDYQWIEIMLIVISSNPASESMLSFICSQISMWMTNISYFRLMSSDVVNRLELIANIHGIEQVEDYFNNIPKQLKTLETGNTDKFNVLISEMEERESYNILLNLLDKFNVLISEMEKRDIVVTNTHSIQRNACAAASDLEGIDKVMAEWESNPVVPMGWD